MVGSRAATFRTVYQIFSLSQQREGVRGLLGSLMKLTELLNQSQPNASEEESEEKAKEGQGCGGWCRMYF